MQNFTVKQGIKYLFLVVFTVMSFESVYAQSGIDSDCDECNEPFSVSKLTHKIEFGNSINFQVSNPSGVQINSNISQYLKENKLASDSSNVVFFDKPGTYVITFSSLPSGKYLAHTETVSVEVSPYSIKFLVDKASMSGTIVNGQSTNGIILTIPVEVRSYNGEKVKFGPFKNSSTGVEGIDVVLDEQIELTPGIHNLKFKLQGTPTSSGPCQIGFFNLLGEGYFYNFLISK